MSRSVMKLNLLDNAVIQLLNDENNVVFSFELKRLDEYWNGDAEEYEYLHVSCGGTSLEYVIIVMTTAAGQGGIVAVVDTASGEIIHYNDGEFAIFAEVYKDYVITIRGVQYWGVKYHNCVDAVKLGTKDITSGGQQITVDETISNNFTYTISDDVIRFKDKSGQTAIVKIADLIGKNPQGVQET